MTNELNLPEGWEVKDFETCLDKVKYTNKIKRKNFLKSGKFPIVSQEQEYINGYWNDFKDVFKIIKPVIIFGDHTQVLKYVDFDFVLGADGVKILQPISSINGKFFYYFLMCANVKSLGYARHYRLLKDKSVPVPSTFEQKRIVTILDSAFENIARAKESAEKNLKNANEIFESYLQSVFENKGEGWEEKTLGAACKISSKLIDPQEETYIDLYHVGGANIESMTGCLINLKTSKEENLISGKFPFDNSMVLYSKIRPYLVKVVRPDFAGICSADIYPLKPTNSILDRNFLYYLLMSADFTDFAIKGSARAGMPKVNRKHLFSYSTFFPTLSEQKSIVAKLDALSTETKKLDALYTQKLADLEELKKSILQKAFNGELTEASA